MRESSELFPINEDLSITRFFMNNEDILEPELPFFSSRIEPLERPISPRININLDEDEYMERLFYFRPPIRRIRIYQHPELKELESNNENFIKENNIKFNLYPLYINWKKIESKNPKEQYFNILKLFGYFGVAIFEILTETMPKIGNNYYYTYKNFLSELNKIYKKEFTKEEIEENKFYKKLLEIKDDVISLVKNKIMIFKEIPVFLIVLKFYQSFYSSLDDIKNNIESLKYQFIIISYLTRNEYEIIYDKYLKNFKSGRYLGYNIFQRTKVEYIRQIKRNYNISNCK